MRYGFQLAAEYEGTLPARAVVERKFDGVLALWDGPRGELWNRSGNRITAKFPEVHPPKSAVLLGEVCVLPDGPMAPDDFEAIEGRIHRENPVDIRIAAHANPASFVAFDLLEWNGGSMMPCPFSERRAALVEYVPDGEDGVVLAPEWPCASKDELNVHLDRAMSAGWEGLVVKDLDAPYVPTVGDRRLPHYLKLPLWTERWFPIVRYERTDRGGFVLYVVNEGREQRVALGSVRMQQRVLTGEAKSVLVRYKEVGEEGAMRQATARALSHDSWSGPAEQVRRAR